MSEAIANFITNHWFLTFLIVIWILETFEGIVKSILRIFGKKENSENSI